MLVCTEHYHPELHGEGAAEPSTEVSLLSRLCHAWGRGSVPHMQGWRGPCAPRAGVCVGWQMANLLAAELAGFRGDHGECPKSPCCVGWVWEAPNAWLCQNSTGAPHGKRGA